MKNRILARIGGWLWTVPLPGLAGWFDDRAGFCAVLDDMGIRK